ncbi:hypothetical protein AB6A40_001184 [Gnathostoma spinigerum]|uniref:Protein kinase domain-containing protein n=1 Tax=Gnathostoma spinigerum TaxID=75299 RepID=A0ABD6EDT1_9BILA
MHSVPSIWVIFSSTLPVPRHSPSYVQRLITIVFIFFSIPFHATLQHHTACIAECDKYESNVAFETCLNKCAKDRNFRSKNISPPNVRRSNSKYPPPPFDLAVEVSNIIGEVKFLEAVIYWKVQPDSRRIGFYLSVTAVEKWCEKEFPGYLARFIGPEETFHIIPPLTTESQPLEIQHDCTYDIKMHSKPYPYGDVAFLSALKYKVPTCIDGYCSCESQKPVVEPQNVLVSAILEKNQIRALVSWTYPAYGKNTHQFRFDLSERYHFTQLGLNSSEIPTFRIIELPRHVIYAEENQTSYSTVLPVVLRADEEYRLIMFTMNDQLCNSREVTVLFTSSNPKTVDIHSAQPISNEVFSQGLSEVGDSNKFRIKTEEGATIINDRAPKRPERLKVPQIQVEDQIPMKTNTFAESTVIERHSNSDIIDEFHLSYALLGVGCAFITSVMLFSFTLLYRMRKRFQSKKSPMEKSTIIPWAIVHANHSMIEANILYRGARKETPAIQPNDYQIQLSELRIGKIVGQGAFGTVYLGTAVGIDGFAGRTTVAVKQLKENADESERKQFLAEMKMLKQVGKHPNIVAMYGCCTKPTKECMVMEYVPYGDLKHYLQNLRKQLDIAVVNLKMSLQTADPTLCPTLSNSLGNSAVTMADDSISSLNIYRLDPNELQSFAVQVANGMAHIESLGIIHRDLAARNILVGQGKQLKISDFGLSRHGVYVKTSKGVIPLRWLSIEAIQNYLYSTKSDVWAYGVVLWEICTLGGFPYPTISDKDLLNYLQEGSRLEKPASCSNEIYDVMMECWKRNPADRPSFTYLCEYLSELNSHDYPYVEFVAIQDLPPPVIQSS